MKNTDRELWRERDDYYADSVSVTESGLICIDVGGTVICKRPADWHRAATPPEAAGRGDGDWIRMAGSIIDKVHMTAEDYVNEEIVEQLKHYFGSPEAGGESIVKFGFDWYINGEVVSSSRPYDDEDRARVAFERTHLLENERLVLISATTREKVLAERPAPPSGEQSQPWNVNALPEFLGWSKPPDNWRKDILAVRDLRDGRREYILHNGENYWTAVSASGEQSSGPQGKASELARSPSIPRYTRTDALDETESLTGEDKAIVSLVEKGLLEVAPAPQEGREIDWDDDEAVVRAAVPNIQVHWNIDGEKPWELFTESESCRVSYARGWFKTEKELWPIARSHPLVIAFERRYVAVPATEDTREESE